MTKEEQKNLINQLYGELDQCKDKIKKLEELTDQYENERIINSARMDDYREYMVRTLKDIIYVLITKQNPDIEKLKIGEKNV